MANPIVVPISKSTIRIFFNSRTLIGAAEIWSVDVDSDDFAIDQTSIRKQYSPDRESPEYCKRGLSLGNFFYHQGAPCLSFMGWRDNVEFMWEGSIGFLKLDTNFNFTGISETPFLTAFQTHSLSLSYPHVTSIGSSFHIWAGCTLTWDGGNGEMVHPLRKYVLSHDLSILELIHELPSSGDSSQAFSRPSLIKHKGAEILAYSVRGSRSDYRIEICDLTSTKAANRQSNFEPNGNGWESQMVEYPYLIEINGHLFMFYNGNGFGQSGIGRVEVDFQFTP